MSQIPRISVVIPAHNSASTVGNSIRSVLDGLVRDLEIVVVDDGSTDATAIAVEAVDDDRVRLVGQSNGGPSAARNRGVTACRSEFLTFLDADDLAEIDWLETFLTHMDPHVGVVRTGARWTGHNPGERRPAAGFSALAGVWAVRRSMFTDVGGYDESLRFGENHELYRRLRKRAAELGLTEVVVDATPIVYQRVQRPITLATARDRRHAANVILQRHGAECTPAERGNYQRIAGVNSARLSDWTQARAHFRHAFREHHRWQDLVRLAIAYVHPLARRQWSSHDREHRVDRALQLRSTADEATNLDESSEPDESRRTP